MLVLGDRISGTGVARPMEIDVDVAAFLLVYLMLGAYRRPDGQPAVNVAELIENDAALAAERAWFEPWLRAEGLRSVEFLRQVMLGTLRYLSNRDGGPIAVLLPRDEVLQLAGSGPGADSAALAVARSLQRFVRSQAAAVQQPHDERFFAQLEEVVARVGGNGMPRNQRYMSTDQIAKWLGLAPKTVRRLFTERKLTGRKVGNEWRATREQLEESPYLRQRRRRGDAALE